jgi:hypothetical protein
MTSLALVIIIAAYAVALCVLALSAWWRLH